MYKGLEGFIRGTKQVRFQASEKLGIGESVIKSDSLFITFD
jgi:hypothetical protein